MDPGASPVVQVIKFDKGLGGYSKEPFLWMGFLFYIERLCGGGGEVELIIKATDLYL
ncbi:hypothetical protein GXP67_21200 [Rhodocytophaga rosea]|uniref:Uncharacterized protein n=1 Tax=Rhodocytophaga rosea TaxID=2704465 RepID=A0A6C0GLT6_9BACT|nr:hypothetical protein [Rhodocytophaga rosea]QHT68988.1 hypothetical protein GXP67_21200 [Rhodocytophaga rosea]